MNAAGVGEFFTGDDWSMVVTLNADGAPLDVSGATTIKAVIVSSNCQSAVAIVPEEACNPAATGADWANGVVVIDFPKANTAITDYGTRYLEVQVTDGGRDTTWPRGRLTIKKGVLA